MSLKKGDQSNDIKKALFDELIKKFQKCHDIIWEGGKRDPTTAFDEFSKLLMAKMYDEIRTLMGEEYSFQWKINDTTRDIVKRIKELYAQVRKLNSKVFKEELGLPENIIAEIVKIIQAISLIETDLDTKGRAFEQFLGKVFRDDYGQYFTPRTVVKFMVEVLEPTKADIIMDPACGSGGFLLNSLLYMIEDQLNHYSEESKFRNFVHQLSGIEINDRVARIAMLDLVIHGGTFNSIECNNALLSYQELGKTQEIEPNKYSLILTNPPFGAVVRDNRILRNYTLGEGRENQKTEILFIERCLDLLRPGGRLGIVLPDSVLTNSSLQYVREFILERTKLLAIISLPHHTFVPSGAGVKSSLLFMNKIDFDEKKPLMYFLKKMDQKKEEFNANKDYPVFMAVAKHIGYDARGEEDINDLLGILNDWKKYISESPLELKKSFVVKNSQLKNNFSADKFVFYSAYKNWEIKNLSEVCEAIFTGKTPARKEYTSKGHKILKVRDLTNKGISWDNRERAFVSQELFLKHQRLTLRVDDILLISAAHHPKYIGEKIDIIDFIPERYKNGVICSAELLVLRVKSKCIDPYYVLSFLKTRDGFNAIQACVRGQTAHIYPKDIRNIKIPIPPEEELNKIRADLENLKEFLRRKSKANEDYLFSLNRLTKFLEES